MKKIIFTFAMSIAMIGCSESADSIVNSVEKPSKSSRTLVAKRNPQPGYVYVGIFEVTIHRASRGCTSGLGFCSFEWFPGPPTIPPFTMPKIESADDGGNRYVEVYKNAEGKHYFDVDAIQPLENAPDLVVDVDVTAVKRDAMDRDLILEAGSYSFDKSIGDFGAYRIYLK